MIVIQIRSFRSFWLVAAILLVTIRPAAAKPGSKIDRSLTESLQSGAATQQIIITVKPGHRAEIRQALEAHGDRIDAEHPLVDALTAEVHSEDVTELARNPWVRALSANATVYAGTEPEISKGSDHKKHKAHDSEVPPAPTGPTLRQQLGLPLRAGTPTGSGIGVVVIDSGISPTADIASRITGFYDFTAHGAATAPYDDYGHGTHIAGLIGSSGLLSANRYQGIAPRVHLIGIKVLDRRGNGKTSDVIDALEFVTANKSRLHAHIINLSLGHPIYAPAGDDPLVQAVENASAAGLVVVVSAGNNGVHPDTGLPGYAGIGSPGDAPSAITIGAVDTHETADRAQHTVAPYSSRGPTWFDGFAKPDLVAPGHRLISDVRTGSYLYKHLKNSRVPAGQHEGFLRLSGTSMAAAVASGVVALVLEQRRIDVVGLRREPFAANSVKAILEYTAIGLGSADVLTEGAGEINPLGAISLVNSLAPVPPNKPWLVPAVTTSTTIGGVTYVWSQSVLWRDQLFFGTTSLVNNILWGTNIVWGTNILWGNNILWGSNIVWGTAAETWGSNIVWGDRLVGVIDGDNIVWGSDNIVWGTVNLNNIVWGTVSGSNIVWGTWQHGIMVWGRMRNDNIVWGTGNGGWQAANGENIVWGTVFDVTADKRWQ